MTFARTLVIADPDCRNAYSRSGLFCLPEVDCRPDGTGIFTNDPWNCSKCFNEPLAYMPWVPGDVMHFQTNFADYHHGDPSAPVDGFATTASIVIGTAYRVILCYPGGEDRVIANFTTDTMVAWSGEHSYQIVVVDTSLSVFDSLDCWEIRIEALDENGEPVDGMNTETFRRAIDCAEETVVVKSQYGGFDCFNNYYGAPEAFVGTEISFNNKMRFYGLVANIGMSSTASFDFNAASPQSGPRTLFRYNTTKFYPPYQRKLLQNLIDINNFTIDGQQYLRGAYTVEGGLFKIPLEIPCSSSKTDSAC